MLSKKNVPLPTETAVQQLPSAGSGPSGPLNFMNSREVDAGLDAYNGSLS